MMNGVHDMTQRTALDRLLELALVLSQDMAASLPAMELTEARAHVVWEIHHRGPMTQRQIAEALDVTPRNVTGLVDALVDSGFVTREPHPSDRRATLVTFTAKGTRIAKNLEQGHDDLARMLYDDVPADAVESFVTVSEHVLARLAQHDATRRNG